MRHAKNKLMLNRFTSWRKATLISLSRNLLVYQSIKTTVQKAKAARTLVEKLITLGKENNITAKRNAFKILQDHKLVSLLFSEIAPRFKSRSSGYTRITRLGARRGDNAQMVVLELTEIKKKETRKPKQEKEPKSDKAKEEKIESKPEKDVEEKPKTEVALKEKPPISKRPTKNFLGGLKNIFKKERDAL